ncbi:MAG: HupE/UreJ family protein, partial [Verrucomicrobiaceae bacterium]
NKIETMTITELTEQRYEIRYDAPPPGLSEFGAPVLPKDFEWLTLDTIPQSEVSTSLVFAATDNRVLGPDDTIILPWQSNGVLVTARWKSGVVAREYFRSGGEGILVRMSQLQASSGSTMATAKRFTRIGFEHILGGFDHLLFVAGLMLIVRDRKKLVLTITAFTISHSLTLALAALGYIHVPQQAVEAIIALSILLLAVEAVALRKGHEGLTSRYPWLVSGGFGLVHGLGFAGALNELGLPREDITVSLLFFNLGVEAGQLFFVMAWFLLMATLKGMRVRPSEKVALVGHYALGILSATWFLERTIGIFR